MPAEPRTFAASSVPQIFVGLTGQAALECSGERIALERGKAIVVPANAGAVTIQSESQDRLRPRHPGLERLYFSLHHG